MPFEPKLYDDPPEQEPWGDAENWDETAQLDLPDDLAMLAEQLRDDAKYLAAQHPADATPAQRQAAWEAHVQFEKTESRPVRGLPWRWISAAAAVVVAVAGGAWTTHLMIGQPSDAPPALAITDRDDTSGEGSHRSTIDRQLVIGEPLAPRDGLLRQENHRWSNELPSDAPRLIPATLLQDVSAPELDGVLDLLEGEESGLSI